MKNKINKNKNPTKVQKPKHTVIKCLFWLILTLLYLINIIFGTVMLLPFWVATGDIIFPDSKYYNN